MTSHGLLARSLGRRFSVRFPNLYSGVEVTCRSCSSDWLLPKWRAYSNLDAPTIREHVCPKDWLTSDYFDWRGPDKEGRLWTEEFHANLQRLCAELKAHPSAHVRLVASCCERTPSRPETPPTSGLEDKSMRH